MRKCNVASGFRGAQSESDISIKLQSQTERKTLNKLHIFSEVEWGPITGPDSH